MRTKNFVLLAFLNCVALSLFADYRPGYIIKLSNDTISGYIDFVSGVENSKECRFKTNLEMEPKVYRPEDIKEYRFINGKYFVTKQTMVDGKPQMVFLEWLIKGRANILSFNESISKIRLYIQLDNDSLREIPNTKKYKEKRKDYKNEDFDVDVERQEYIGYLKYYLKDCPSIYSEIDNSGYNRESFINIAKQYHYKTCGSKDCIVFEDHSKLLKYEIGSSISYIHSTTSGFDESQQHINSVSSIGAGISLDISNLRLISPNMSLHIEISYFNLQYTGHGPTRYMNPTTQVISNPDLSFDLVSFNVLRIPIQFRYTLKKNWLSPYFAAGTTFNLRSDYYSNQSKLGLLTNRDIYTDPVKFGSFQPGVNIQMGFKKDLSQRLKIEMGIGYEKCFLFYAQGVNDIVNNDNLILQFGLSYQIK